MEIESKLKPLYANLKRLKIGSYLHSKEFNLFTIENDIDELWKKCKKDISKKSKVIILGHHDTEDDEAAFMLLITVLYDEDLNLFDDILLTVLVNFSKWTPEKLDYSSILENLKEIEIPKKEILEFTKEFRKIQSAKPAISITGNSSHENHSAPLLIKNKIFVIHGHDNNSKMELCNILKEEFNLIPVVLQETPNQTIETIISKFERLASECSSAIVLFTPDDKVGDNSRARQNVILELGYFLGKFHKSNERKIIILKKGNVEIPSDINGVLYLKYNSSPKEIFYDLKKHFDNWGLNFNKSSPI